MSEEEEEEQGAVYHGKVIWFKLKPGLGFIHWEKNGVKQTDMFIHYSDIDMPGYRLLKANQEVSFSIGKNHAGQDKAINLKVIE